MKKLLKTAAGAMIIALSLSSTVVYACGAQTPAAGGNPTITNPCGGGPCGRNLKGMCNTIPNPDTTYSCRCQF